ncbi:MAG: class I SAM-dependent methyltransferase [candidate division Zixibacteria bacterium]|nr:class I SAM-dependent methyltransferase [candidate division Zixibacteria bacterium]
MPEKYSKEAAARFWSKRLKSTDPLAAVLTYNAPKILNECYNKWEIKSLQKALPHSLAGKKALDIGCGTGRISLLLAKLGADVTSLDLSAAMLKHLKLEARRRKVASRITTIESSADKLPLNDNLFDIVTCFGLLEHLPPVVRRKTILEAFRLLKPKGKMLAVVNNSASIFLKNSYLMKEQQRNGYFVSLVGLNWLEKICEKQRMKVKVLSANPNYAAMHYIFRNSRGSSRSKSQEGIREILRQSLKQDLEVAPTSRFSSILASHFLVELRKAN